MKKSLSLKLKTIIATFFIISVVVIIFTTINHYNEKDDLTTNAKKKITTNIDMLSSIIDLHVNDRQKTVNTAMNLAHSIFYASGEIKEDKTKKNEVLVTNQITKEQHKVQLNRWVLGGWELYNSINLVDTIKQLSVETVTIFQKIDVGYLRISTNVIKTNGERAVGTFIPNNSPVIKTIEGGSTYTGRAYVVNAWYLTAYEPIYIDGVIKGILYVGVKEQDFAYIGRFFTDNGYQSGNTILIDNDGKLLLNKKDDDIEDLIPLFFDKLSTQTGENAIIEFVGKAGELHTLYYIYNEKINAFVVSLLHSKEFNQPLNSLLMSNLVDGLLNILIIALLLVLFLSYQIFKPIDAIVEAMKRIALKDVDFQMVNKRDDEIGNLYKSVNAINRNFKDILTNINDTASSVLAAGKELSTVSIKLSERASEQASTTEEIATSMEEILATINSNTERAELTGRASKKSADRMTQSNKTFNQLLKSVAEISDKIYIITEIAGKTDILSVNAAIEAARAGEVGEGFAVVAHEIRKLADTTKNASHDIIELSNSGHELSKVAGKKIAKTILDIVKSAKLVNEIVTSSREQQIGVEAVNTSMQQLTEITNENSASAEQMSASSEQLSAQAEQLKNLISVFNIGEQQEVVENVKLTAPQRTGVNLDLSRKDDEDDDFENF